MKKITIEHTEELRQIQIQEGDSLEIVLNRKNNHSIKLYVSKDHGICKLKFIDPDVSIHKTVIYEWKDEENFNGS